VLLTKYAYIIVMINGKGTRGGGFVARVAPMRISCRILVEKLNGIEHLGGGGGKGEWRGSFS